MAGTDRVRGACSGIVDGAPRAPGTRRLAGARARRRPGERGGGGACGSGLCSRTLPPRSGRTRSRHRSSRPDRPRVRSMIRFETSHGGFTVELYEEDAPLTVANFLRYVDEGFFDGTMFHRIVPGFVIQGGGLTGRFRAETNPCAGASNEADNGVRNERGTLSMARTDEIHSATSQFFVNLADNEFLDHRPGQYGYAVFGRVTEGMDVIDRIAGVAHRPAPRLYRCADGRRADHLGQTHRRSPNRRMASRPVAALANRARAAAGAAAATGAGGCGRAGAALVVPPTSAFMLEARLAALAHGERLTHRVPMGSAGADLAARRAGGHCLRRPAVSVSLWLRFQLDPRGGTRP